MTPTTSGRANSSTKASAPAPAKPPGAKPRNSTPAVPPSWRDHLGPAVAMACVLVLDRLTKLWALASLRVVDPSTGAAGTRTIVLIPGCLDLSYAENTGAAFSIFHGHPGVLALVAFVIAAAIFWWYWRTPREHRGTRIALGLLLGGAIGNLIDRVVRGSVVDFIHAFWRQHHWPTFNVADSAICVGIALLILWSYREQKTK